jgi:hypothetical protein
MPELIPLTYSLGIFEAEGFGFEGNSPPYGSITSLNRRESVISGSFSTNVLLKYFDKGF